MQKEKSEFKIKSESLVFGTYTIDCNKEVQSECDRTLGKGNSSSWLLNDIKPLSYNCRSILTTEKKIKLDNLLRIHQSDIVALSETWLDNYVENTAVFCTDVYEVIHRSDRKTGPHGGVLIAVKTSSKLNVIVDQSVIFDFGSYLFVKLNSLMLCVTAIYNPPHDSHSTLNWIIFEKFLSEVNKRLNVRMVESNLNTTQWILCGDLNLTSVD